MNLAFYGTLRDPDILRSIVPELEGAAFQSITVQGWACLRIEGEAYPLLRSDPSAATIFHLYHDCSEVSWRRLVDYEGSEYFWTAVAIEGQCYRIFMAEPMVKASPELWDLETFQRHYKVSYQKQLEGFEP